MSKNLEKRLFHLPKREEVVEIYHDESYISTGSYFCHQFMIIPLCSREIFNEALQCKRKEFRGNALTINWKKIRKKRNINRNLIAQHWIDLLVRGMSNYPFSYVSNGKPYYFKERLGIKLGTFVGNLSDSFWSHLVSKEEKTRRKYETLLRMGIKGCLHYCFNPEFTCYKKVKIKRFCTDGYVFKKPSLNRGRVIGRLEDRLREYINLENDLKIEHINKSKNKTKEVNFEELVDLVLGSTRYLCTNHKEEKHKDRIVASLKEVYGKTKRGSSFKHSSYFRTFTLSICNIDEHENLNFSNWVLKNNNIPIGEYNHSLFKE